MNKDMNKIAEFLAKWAFALVLLVIAILLLFALGCTIHTAITNAVVGVFGTIGVCIALARVVGLICIEIKEGK